VVATVFVTPARATEPDAVIIDSAGFFSASALADATDVIRSIEAFHDRDVRVETYAEVPLHLREDLARDGRDKFYDDWLNRRARHLGVRGVFVLITRSPGRVQVGVHKATQRRAFPPGDRDALRDQLAAAFQVGRYDHGLLDRCGPRPVLSLHEAPPAPGACDPLAPAVRHGRRGVGGQRVSQRRV
jgi:hypothetical protein